MTYGAYDPDRFDAEIDLERSMHSAPYTCLVLADLLKVSLPTIYRGIESGRLPTPTIVGRSVSMKTPNEWSRDQVIDILVSWTRFGEAPIKHGTKAGYGTHRRRGIPVCDACREAQNAYNRAHRQSRKAA